MVISDHFRAFDMLVDHLLAVGLVPLDYITFVSFVLPLLHICILQYVISSSRSLCNG